MTAKRIKTGYAADVAPELLDSAEKAGLAIPRRAGSGFCATQKGKLPVVQRKYGKRYEAVSVTEAQTRLIQRKNGELPLLDSAAELPDNWGLQQSTPQAQPDFDALTGVSVNSGTPPVVADDTAAPRNYLNKRIRVNLELETGVIGLTAIDVKATSYGVTILLPLVADAMTFIPTPGSEILIQSKVFNGRCYFPGTHFEIPELKLSGLVFIKATE